MNHQADDTNRACDKTGCTSEAEKLRSRRRFLEKVATITFGTMTLTLFPGWSSDEESRGDEDSPGPSEDQTPIFGYLVDTQKCVGTGICLTACRVENDVPEGCHRTWVERYVHFKDGTTQVDLVPETGYADSDIPAIDPLSVERAYFVPKNCNHC